MAINRIVLAGAILLFSFFGIYGSMNENKFLAFIPFLLMIIASLVFYQTFASQVPLTSFGIVGFFVGRLLFLGLILYANSVIFSSIKSNKIQKDGINTFGVATRISSRYLRGKWNFYRHFTYVANGKILESKVRFSYDLNRGDTIFLKYSRSNPYVIEFEKDNEQNRKYGVVK